MADQKSVNGNVGGSAEWTYCTALQFFARMINAALIDCKCALGFAQVSRGGLVALHLPGADQSARPTDEALLARDWIANSITPRDTWQRSYLSFRACCEQLGVDWDKSRNNLLAVIDSAGDFTSDEAKQRIAALRLADLPDDKEPLFDAPRVVPAVDQLNLFGESEAAA